MPVQLNGADLITSFSDVEEGVFTPTIADDTLNGTSESQVYDIQVGRYTKIGKRIFFTLNIRITNLGCLTTSEQTRIMGLPFTHDATSQNTAALSVGSASSLAINATENVSARVNPNTAYVSLHLWDATAGTTVFLVSELSVTGSLNVSGHYDI